ncbi:hypothetical protein ACU4GR_22235 [Methylobacterium oryzae CBMB20]
MTTPERATVRGRASSTARPDVGAATRPEWRPAARTPPCPVAV